MAPLGSEGIKLMLNLLLFDPGESIRKLLKELINESHLPVDLTAVKAKNQLLYAISENEWHPDIALIRLDNESDEAFEIIRIIKNTKRFEGIYVIAFLQVKYLYDVAEVNNKGADLYVNIPEDADNQKRFFKKILAMEPGKKS